VEKSEEKKETRIAILQCGKKRAQVKKKKNKN